jgi:hypothetical protein
MIMATSSFSHNVVIKDKESLKALVEAVETSQKQEAVHVELAGSVKHADKNWIKANLKK